MLIDSTINNQYLTTLELTKCLQNQLQVINIYLFLNQVKVYRLKLKKNKTDCNIHQPDPNVSTILVTKSGPRNR